MFRLFKKQPEATIQSLMPAGVMIPLSLVFLGIVIVEILGYHSPIIQSLEIMLGVVFFADWVYRLKQHKKPRDFFAKANNIFDLVVFIAIAAKFLIASTLFLQVLSGLRIFRIYRLLEEITEKSTRWSQYYTTTKAGINLFVFIFVVSEIVFLQLGPNNPNINTYVDALYFTITTLTTTGFGDITVSDTADKLLVIFIMVFGVTLFLKLASQLFRPQKVFTECGRCGLVRHDPDASHCKHCGKVVKIKTEGGD